VFFLSAIIYLIGALIFGLISKGETQPWAIRLSDLTKNDTLSNVSTPNIIINDNVKREVVNESFER
jgi:hypothetical protein